jgi:hypothetical protein
MPVEEAAFMKAECTAKSFPFHSPGRREIVGRFDGGDITSDGGGLLLREVESKTGILEQFADCFRDYRDPARIEHTVAELVAQRVYGLALGYEDLNDHEELRTDPLLAAMVGKTDPKGENRGRERDRGKGLAGKSTLNRLELTPEDAHADSRYKKIVVDPQAVDRFLVDVFLQAHRKPPRRIVLDLDATDDPLHGSQEGRFFHGYYRTYCYLPLYIFCGEFLLCARLRRSNIDASHGAVDELARIVAQIRQTWPKVRIVIRADSGFAREEIMAWCERQKRVDYVLGLAKNERLTRALREPLREVKERYDRTGKPNRRFHEIRYRTRQTWSVARRVVGKAEHLAKGANPRFLVTSISINTMKGKRLYEKLYCARGDMENRIKEQQLFLFADRTSTATMRANQIRLWFSSVAYLLMHALRREGLAKTSMAKAQCDTIRLKLLKIGAQVKVTTRKIWVSFAESYPYRSIFAQVYCAVRTMPPLRC